MKIFYSKKDRFGEILHAAMFDRNFKPMAKDYDFIAEVLIEDLEEIFREFNIGLTPRLMRIRSMSNGDVCLDDTRQLWMCSAVGWRLIDNHDFPTGTQQNYAGC